MRKGTGWLSTLVLPVLFCAGVYGQDDSRPDLTGKWQLNSSKSDIQLNRVSDVSMVITEKDGKINIIETDKAADGKARTVTFNCTTDGKDCKVPEDKATASFWYNGPMLVSMVTKHNGSEVVRERLSIKPDTKELDMEVSSLVPQSDKKDKLVFEKQ